MVDYMERRTAIGMFLTSPTFFQTSSEQRRSCYLCTSRIRPGERYLSGGSLRAHEDCVPGRGKLMEPWQELVFERPGQAEEALRRNPGAVLIAREEGFVVMMNREGGMDG